MTSFRTRTARFAVAAALVVGLAGTSTAAFATSPVHPQGHGPTDLAPGGNGPDDPTPPQGPGGLTNGEPDDCPPILASCDLAPNPGNPDDGGNGGGNGGSEGAEVDAPVVANPTFTG